MVLSTTCFFHLQNILININIFTSSLYNTNYAQSTINEITTKEDINKFTRQTLRKIKNQTATKLLNLENTNSISFSSGGCSYCCKCSHFLNNEPCKKPEKCVIP